jgi:hypothetical protein
MKVKTDLKAGAVVFGVSAGGDAIGGNGGAGGAGGTGTGSPGGPGGPGGVAIGGVGVNVTITVGTVF